MTTGGFLHRLRTRQNRTTITMHDAMITLVPGYHRLPASKCALLLDEVRETWDVTLKRAMTNEPFTAEDLSLLAMIGQRRATDHFPLADIRAGFEVAYVTGLRECFASAAADDRARTDRFHFLGSRPARPGRPGGHEHLSPGVPRYRRSPASS
ncbi:hypothetical protein [Fodinicola feengrottensis]|uniref:hypothetical protein n=1 Tax=Fodinicola feengrottensis TaxID=435914 RepID=UPI0013D03CDB|nr:hypothetical protein [Fodinicola feengrottensis]